MSKRRGDFDDDEGFFESIMKRKNKVPMPDSMAKILKTAVALAVVIVVALIAWAVWPSGDHAAEDTVPIVRAESGEYKVEPEDKGGMIIPNKDSTIFETMDNDRVPEKKVESLLEDSEKPMKKDEVFVAGTAPVEETPQDKPVVVKAEPSENIVQEKTEPVKAIAKKVEVKEVQQEKPKEKKIDIIDALKEEAGTKKPEPVKVAKGTVYIQLASVKSDAEAKAKWAKLKSSYSSLSSLSLKVQKADLGAKGIFYRVQAGPTSADNAASICAKIKAAKGDCLIVK